MALFKREQVWKQKKGKVRVRILWCCNAGMCVSRDARSQQYQYVAHVHVNGWNGNTGEATAHTVMRVSDIQRDWFLEKPA